MKLSYRDRLPALTLVVSVALATLARLPAEAQLQPQAKHHHYMLIDVGTFGGPSSYFNNLNLTDRFGFGTAFYGFAQVLNKQGTLAGFAETSTPDPYPDFCYTPDCFVAHAFEWQGGVKTDLGVLRGGVSSEVFWITSDGLITGNSQNGELDPLIPGLPEIRAVLWKHGEITDLGTLGGNESFAAAANNRGQITGVALNTIPDPFSFYYFFLQGSMNGTQTRAFLWENGVMKDLGTLGGPDAFPNLVNQRGQVAGFSYTDNVPTATAGLPTLHPFLWEEGKGMIDLGTFGGTQTASVNGLNEHGQVVGGSYLPGDIQIHPFLWDGDKLVDLTAPPFEGGANGEASWINDGGEVVGLAGLPVSCDDSGDQIQHAFLWRQGAMTDLGTVAGTPNSAASFINAHTQVVGLSFACDFSVFNAILWENGSMADLNTLIAPDSPFHLYSASFIDDGGEIAAFGSLSNGDTHAVLLIPCDENHPDVEGCDYSMVEAPAAVAQTTAPVRNAYGRTLPPSLMRRMSRYHFPGLAFGSRN